MKFRPAGEFFDRFLGYFLGGFFGRFLGEFFGRFLVEFFCQLFGQFKTGVSIRDDLVGVGFEFVGRFLGLDSSRGLCLEPRESDLPDA